MSRRVKFSPALVTEPVTFAPPEGPTRSILKPYRPPAIATPARPSSVARTTTPSTPTARRPLSVAQTSCSHSAGAVDEQRRRLGRWFAVRHAGRRTSHEPQRAHRAHANPCHEPGAKPVAVPASADAVAARCCCGRRSPVVSSTSGVTRPTSPAARTASLVGCRGPRRRPLAARRHCGSSAPPRHARRRVQRSDAQQHRRARQTAPRAPVASAQARCCRRAARGARLWLRRRRRCERQRL